ncbi:MAG: heavy-metal-associated domain-containing protein [Fusobacteriaceae bacterium]
MKKTIKIQGMSCMKCVTFVKELLSEIKGIESTVSVEIGKVVIITNDKFDETEIKNILSKEEFEVISIIND